MAASRLALPCAPARAGCNALALLSEPSAVLPSSCQASWSLLAARWISHGQATPSAASRIGDSVAAVLTPLWYGVREQRRQRCQVLRAGASPASSPSIVDSPPFTEEALDRAAQLAQAALREMLNYLEEVGSAGPLEELTVQLAAHAAVNARVDKLDGAFMLAIDTMLMKAERQKDTQSVALLLIVKQEVLAALAKRFPPHVQVVELLTRVPLQEVRKDLICLAAAGGGEYAGGDYGMRDEKLLVPAAKLEDVLRQTDDVVYDMEERAQVADRRLLARLVLIREELRTMVAGGIHDPRSNTRALSNLPQKEVEFLSALAGMRPSFQMTERIAHVLAGHDEGADRVRRYTPEAERGEGFDIDAVRAAGLDDEELADVEHAMRMRAAGQAGETRDGAVVTTLPVRPGMLLDTLTKLTGSALSEYRPGSDAGILMQMRHVRRVCLEVLDELAGWEQFREAEEFRP